MTPTGASQSAPSAKVMSGTTTPKLAKPDDDIRLPPLRAELELLPGAADASGQPTWLIHDPLMNRFIQIEPAAREALKHWGSCQTASELVGRVEADGKVRLDVASISGLID
ncbi:MAG: hypothetical protein K2Y05_12440, partial [Hyphomicrobiaceae bacterium]|nr:hypothetical protein [Hyphomicrobiaceae bacterium]